jgi:hypothetical protein
MHGDEAHDELDTFEPSIRLAGRVGTTSPVIRWVDAHASPLDLLAGMSPESTMRRVGQG